MMDGSQPDWLSANCASWDERVPLHLKAHSYDLRPLRAGRGNLQPIEEGEIGSVDGLRVLHLQCHFGRDTLTLAQRGAKVVGVDFSGEAITVARRLATELGLDHRGRAETAEWPNLRMDPSSGCDRDCPLPERAEHEVVA
jgi:2-polyprenyl-3-methyl-5-hydroxy-6-metoxy-1,4-benzoquinol methylase